MHSDDKHSEYLVRTSICDIHICFDFILPGLHMMCIGCNLLIRIVAKEKTLKKIFFKEEEMEELVLSK